MMPDVTTVNKMNQKHLNTKPNTPPWNERPSSAVFDDEKRIPQGAAESPKVQIAIRDFLLFSFHSGILDILCLIFSFSYSLNGISDTPFVH